VEYRSPEEALAILVFFVGFPRISLHFVVAGAEPEHAGRQVAERIELFCAAPDEALQQRRYVDLVDRCCSLCNFENVVADLNRPRGHFASRSLALASRNIILSPPYLPLNPQVRRRVVAVSGRCFASPGEP
jgi:hypothetical protein